MVLVIIVTVVWYVVSVNIPHNRIVFINVGQGDAAFIETVDGFQILIDTGFDSRAVSALGSILPPWDKSIDLVILTHLHADHVGGLRDISNGYKITKVLVNVQNYDSSIVAELKEVLSRDSIGSVEEFVAGESIIIPSGVTLNAIWPKSSYITSREVSTDDINDTSIVVVLDMFGVKTLFSGDLELGREEFAHLLNIIGDIDILKVPHHGSAFSVSNRSLDWLQPEVAIVSVGENSYGHPHSDALGLMQRYGVNVYRTDVYGNVTIDVKESDSSYRTVKQYD
ncbi:MBL fold metallo-hydrolase [bacterium]|nr:MBL fold metallo-hydrolase [bacterium]NCS96925.1 MBL fold metallo-hydrolase [bacterium]